MVDVNKLGHLNLSRVGKKPALRLLFETNYE